MDKAACPEQRRWQAITQAAQLATSANLTAVEERLT